MPSLIANIGDLQENSTASLSLDADAVLPHTSHHKVWIDRTETNNGWCYSGAAGGIRQIGIRIRHGLQKGNNAWLAKDDVAFRFVEEKSQAAPNCGLVIAEGRICEAQARAEEILRFVETTRRGCGHDGH